MTRGRPKTPLALKISRGTYRQDRDGKLSDHVVGVPLASIPTPPAALGDVGRAKWTETATMLQRLGMLEERFLDALQMYCKAFDDLADAEATIRVQGRYTSTASGRPKLHPACTVADQARDEIRRYLTEFGMTPSASSRVSTSSGIARKPAVPTRKSSLTDPL